MDDAVSWAFACAQSSSAFVSARLRQHSRAPQQLPHDALRGVALCMRRRWRSGLWLVCAALLHEASGALTGVAQRRLGS